MSRKTESKPATPSVIARLMGLDELQSQEPVNKQRKLQRVLSENYLRKVASIGAWEKRSFDERCSFQFSIEEKKGFKDAFEVIESVEIEKGSDSSAVKGRVNLRLSPERKHMKGSGFVDSRKGCSENSFKKPDCLITKHFYDQDNDNPKVIQKLENGFVKYSRRKYGHDNTSMVPSPSSRKIVILKPKPGEDETNKKDKGFLGRRKGNSHAQAKERNNFFDGVKSTMNRSIRCSENTSDISFEPPRLGFNGAQCLTKEPEFLMISSQNNSDMNNRYEPSCYNLGGSYMAHEVKEQIFQRLKVTKDFRENGFALGHRGRSRTLGEMLAFPDQAKSAHFRGPFGISSKDGWKNSGIGDLRSQSYSISVGSPLTKTPPKAFHVDSYTTNRLVFPWAIKKSIKQVSSGKDCPKIRNLRSNCKQSQSSPDLEPEMNQFLEENSMFAEDCMVPEMYSASQSIVSDMVVALETPNDATKSTGNHNQHQFGSMSEKDHHTSDAWNQQEDISMKISEECSTDPDFLVTLETANQPSPVSVLDTPFTEGNSLSSKCFLSVTASLNDVKRQLEFLKSDSSDDEKDAVEELLKEVNEYSTKLSGVAERRDFSYLVDVLAEAGFHNRNPDILFNGCHFPETPISLSVFETLEKKYGERISWKRSERRLLFDRINSGLMEILQPCLGAFMWAKPVARRLSYSQNSKEIVEELYKLLVSQENEAKTEVKDSSGKIFGKDDGWLSLGYDIEAIGRELENSLIDELVAEILSL